MLKLQLKVITLIIIANPLSKINLKSMQNWEPKPKSKTQITENEKVIKISKNLEPYNQLKIDWSSLGNM